MEKKLSEKDQVQVNKWQLECIKSWLDFHLKEVENMLEEIKKVQDKNGTKSGGKMASNVDK